MTDVPAVPAPRRRRGSDRGRDPAAGSSRWATRCRSTSHWSRSRPPRPRSSCRARTRASSPSCTSRRGRRSPSVPPSSPSTRTRAPRRAPPAPAVPSAPSRRSRGGPGGPGSRRARTWPATEFVPSPQAASARRVLVGYGVMHGVRHRRRPARRAGQAVRPADRRRAGCRARSRAQRRRAPSRPSASWPRTSASTSHGVPATGPDGTVTRERRRAQAAGRPAPCRRRGLGGRPRRRARCRTVDRASGASRSGASASRMAEAMVRSAFTIPHVTVWVEVDVTRTVKLVARLRETPGLHTTRGSLRCCWWRGRCCSRLKSSPEFNAVCDADAREIVHQGHVNLGFAAATPRGLVVPNIKDADQLSLPELAAALARAGRDGQGGAHHAGRHVRRHLHDHQRRRVRHRRRYTDHQPRRVRDPGGRARCASAPGCTRAGCGRAGSCELALSFDHRFIDGATGSRFLSGVARCCTTRPCRRPAVDGERAGKGTLTGHARARDPARDVAGRGARRPGRPGCRAGPRPGRSRPRRAPRAVGAGRASRSARSRRRPSRSTARPSSCSAAAARTSVPGCTAVRWSSGPTTARLYNTSVLLASGRLPRGDVPQDPPVRFRAAARPPCSPPATERRHAPTSTGRRSRSPPATTCASPSCSARSSTAAPSCS